MNHSVQWVLLSFETLRMITSVRNVNELLMKVYFIDLRPLAAVT